MNLWIGIETAPESAAMFSWKLRFGEAVETVQPWFLKKTNGRAGSVPCPRHCGCIHRVTGDNYAVCRCGDCDDIRLTAQDVEVWRAQWANLSGRVRDAFELEHKNGGFPVRNVWQVGAFGGDALQIILVVQPDRVAFNEALAQLVARVKAFVVLTPTAAHHDVESRELLGRVNAGLIDLQSNVKILPSGRLVALKTAGELFGPYLPEERQAVEEAAAQRMFALRAKLRQAGKGCTAPHNDVFDLLVVEGRSQRFASRELACSPSLISKRVDEIEAIMGSKLPQLQFLAARHAQMESTVKGDRKRNRKPGSAPGKFAEEDAGDDDAPKEEYGYDKESDQM